MSGTGVPAETASPGGRPPIALAEGLATLLALAGAGASGALLLAVAEGGYAPLPQLIVDLGFPGAALLILVGLLAWSMRWKRLSHGIVVGVAAGLVGTVGLEVIRVIGFRAFGTMPGSLPMLIGVLITNRIMEGPDTVSNLVGWADHFWNGAMFGVIYVLIFGGRRPTWVTIVYGLVLGTLFMLSPVPKAIGAGDFGINFNLGFAPTVWIAHIAFATGLIWVARRSLDAADPLWQAVLQRSKDRPLAKPPSQ